MEKLSDLRNASVQDFAWLKNKIDGMPLLKPYLLDDIALYPNCSPEHTTVGFFRGEPGYVLFLMDRITYTGNEPSLKQLFSDGLIAAETIEQLQFLCRRLPDDAPDQPSEESVPQSAKEEDVTDFEAITVPEAEGSTLDFDFIRNELKKVVIGQDFAVDMVSYQLASHLNKPNPKRPLRVDLNTYTEAHTVHNLTGAPASYIGHDETPVFYSVVENPYTIYIWDEVEKSHPAVLRLFMGIMDEGRCASNKELPDHTREYDFKHSIHIFTTNSPIGELSVKKHSIGFNADIENISYKNGAVSVEYMEDSGHVDVSLVQRIYEQNEKARRALVRTGVLPEIATRFSGFAEFKPLSDEAKIRIIAKTILNTGFEYGIKLKYIAPAIMQEMVNTAGKNGFSVRSYRTITEGYLASTFVAAQAASGPNNEFYRLEGTLSAPQLKPA